MQDKDRRRTDEAIEVSGRERLYTSLSKLQRFQKKLKVQVDRPIPSLLSPVQGEYDQRALLAGESELCQTEHLAWLCLRESMFLPYTTDKEGIGHTRCTSRSASMAQ